MDWEDLTTSGPAGGDLGTWPAAQRSTHSQILSLFPESGAVGVCNPNVACNYGRTVSSPTVRIRRQRPQPFQEPQRTAFILESALCHHPSPKEHLVIRIANKAGGARAIPPLSVPPGREDLVPTYPEVQQERNSSSSLSTEQQALTTFLRNDVYTGILYACTCEG